MQNFNEYEIESFEDDFFSSGNEFNNNEQECDFDIDEPLPTGPQRKPKYEGAVITLGRKVLTVEPVVVVRPVFNPLTWSRDTTDMITRELCLAQIASQITSPTTETDIDEIEFLSGDEPRRSTPIVFRDVKAEAVAAVAAPVDEIDVRLMRQKMTDIYKKDGAQIESYMLRNAKPPAAPASTPVAKTDKIDKILSQKIKIVSKTVVIAAPVKTAFELDFMSADRVQLPELFEDAVEEPSESETEDDESDSPEPEPEIVATPIVLTPLIQKLLAKAAEDRARAAKKTNKKTKHVTIVVTNTKTQIKRHEKMVSRKLQLELFNADFAVARRDVSRSMLIKIYDPRRIMAIYCKLIMQNCKEIEACSRDRAHTIPVPPISTVADLMVASPTELNIIHTPIIPLPLCRKGTECEWFRHMANRELGVNMNQYAKAHICTYLHAEIGTPYKVSGRRLVQCSVMNCTATRHYTPYDDPEIVTIHVTRSTEDCGYDTRNYCVNALTDGCARRHLHAGPVMVAMIMRDILYCGIQDPAKWPITDNTYMYKTSRLILETHIPVKGVQETVESRLKAVAGVWPRQAPRQRR
jgi:hypothetical protein